MLAVMFDVTDPRYLAGKLAYWEGISSDAIGHCDSDTQKAWLAGWADGKADALHLRAQIAGNRSVLPELRPDLLP